MKCGMEVSQIIGGMPGFPEDQGGNRKLVEEGQGP